MIKAVGLYLACFGNEAIQTQLITWDKIEISTVLQPDESFAKATFRTHNNGNSIVRINEASSDSNAIKTIIRKRIINPGESASIEVIFLAEGKEAGLYHNKIEVIFEGYEEPLATLHYMVKIPKLINCEPSILIWGEDNFNDTQQVNLVLDDCFVKALRAIDYDKNIYQISIKSDKFNSSKYTLKIKPISKSRPYCSSIKIRAVKSKSEEIQESVFLFNSYEPND